MSKIKLDTRIEIVYTIFTVERETQTGRNVVKLLTKAIEKKLPPLYTNENKTYDQIKVPLKLFNPLGPGRWYITEMDPNSGLMFGYVTGLGYDEFGYIDLNELRNINVGLGLGIERDILWDSDCTLADVMSGKVF